MSVSSNHPVPCNNKNDIVATPTSSDVDKLDGDNYCLCGFYWGPGSLVGGRCIMVSCNGLCKCCSGNCEGLIPTEEGTDFCVFCGQKYSDESNTASGSSGVGDDEVESISSKSPDSLSRVYMNGEIGSSVGPVGETGMPTMVYPQPVTNLSGPSPGAHFADPHGLNGIIMSQEPLGIAGETGEAIEGADGLGKRGYNSDHTQSTHTPDIPLDELKRMLLSQLEYYFSAENLASDKFLVSQMDSDHYVYISTLSNFNMIKKLTSDIDLVTEVLRESKNIQVHADGRRVRPISHRTVVILRGIPESTPVDEIKGLFDSENCPKCTGCEFAFNDSWYISFESDDDAQQAHRYLREDVREFKGLPIMARIKSKPTTLLSQGVAIGGVPTMKNGYHPPAGVMPSYMASAPPFVPVSQAGPTNTSAPLFAPGQQVPSVFTLPANYAGFNPWAGYYDINSGLAPMYPVNGLQPQASPGYPKSAQMNPRPRNPNQMRGGGPRRTMSSSSDSQGVVTGATGNSNNNSNGHTTGPPPHQQQQQQPYSSRPPQKNNGAPLPLLGMAPQNTPLVSHPPPNHSNHHHQSHHPAHSSLPQNAASSVTSNGRHYNSYSQSVPHNPSDNYHYAGSNRPYRGGGDSRPRSSLGNRRGPPRRDEEGAYEHNPSGPSSATSYRGNPSARTAPPAVSPQNPAQVVVNNVNHQINLDLEGSAFPPLPGSANASNKNGDAPYEGRLSDVVKGVKSLKVAVGSTEKDEVNNPGEIVVSAAEPGSVSSTGEVVVSAGSPTKDEETVGKRDNEQHSSHTLSSGSKKEYREIGVGSADENNHDIRSSQTRNSVVSANRQMADKSTRTDENLLNGDQSSSGGSSRSSQAGNGSYRKSVSQGGSKSPVPAKRGVPPFQNVGVGTAEVPYIPPSSSKSLASSVSSSPAKLPFANPSSSNTTVGNPGRGANSSVAKVQLDNNRSGTATGAGTAAATGSHLNTNDKDAFPTPSFVKSVPSPSSTKPFSGLTDHVPKDAMRNEEERKETGQGDGRKIDDCSTEERDVPVRMSYAQVAQSRKDAAAAAPVVVVQGQSSTSSTSVANSSGPTPSSSSQNVSQGAHDDKKRGYNKDTKDNRAQSKPQRGNSDRERDRDREGNRGFGGRRGFRSRGSSDHSDGGARPPRGPRSPK